MMVNIIALFLEMISKRTRINEINNRRLRHAVDSYRQLFFDMMIF